MPDGTGSASAGSPIITAERAVECLMNQKGETSWTMSELGARLAEASKETPVSVRRLAIQRLLAAGRIVMSDDRAVTLARGLHSGSEH
jgi:hypothetical protein